MGDVSSRVCYPPGEEATNENSETIPAADSEGSKVDEEDAPREPLELRSERGKVLQGSFPHWLRYILHGRWAL